MGANEQFLAFMSDLGVPEDVLATVKLPGPDTPLPPTNATLHVLSHEVGYGTPEREFHALCGVSWQARGSTGEHKYFFEDEGHWHKHVNCDGCLAMLAARSKSGGE
jgi:hypothetical protein